MEIVGFPASAIGGAGVKPPCALAEDRRGERQGKGIGVIVSGGDQEDVPEHPEAVRVSLLKRCEM
jgi:hypothetical protein